MTLPKAGLFRINQVIIAQIAVYMPLDFFGKNWQNRYRTIVVHVFHISTFK